MIRRKTTFCSFICLLLQEYLHGYGLCGSIKRITILPHLKYAQFVKFVPSISKFLVLDKLFFVHEQLCPTDRKLIDIFSINCPNRNFKLNKSMNCSMATNTLYRFVTLVREVNNFLSRFRKCNSRESTNEKWKHSQRKKDK